MRKIFLVNLSNNTNNFFKFNKKNFNTNFILNKGKTTVDNSPLEFINLVKRPVKIIT